MSGTRRKPGRLGPFVEGYRVRLSGPWPAYRFGGLPSERIASA